MSLFWKIFLSNYKKNKYEKKCKSQYKEYLNCLEKKQIKKITDYISDGNYFNQNNYLFSYH